MQSFISTMTVDDATALANTEDSGLDEDARAMLKVAVDACCGGVERVHVIDGTRDAIAARERRPVPRSVFVRVIFPEFGNFTFSKIPEFWNFWF